MANPTDPDADLLTDYFGPLDPVWAPDTPVSDGRPVIVVPVTDLYGDKLFGRPSGVRLDQGSPAWLRLVLYSGQTGAPIQIVVGGYSVPPTVEVRFREATDLDPRIYIPDPADTPSVAEDGRSVLLPVPLEVKNNAGVYNAQVRVTDAGGIERNRSNFTLVTDPGFWLSGDSTHTPGSGGPPTVDAIRLALRDHPGMNRLLQSFEFDLADIGQSIVRGVQTYNTTYPLGGRVFTTITWPSVWKLQLIDGCLVYLMETMATYMRRGHLPYNAAGLEIDDLGKEKDYIKAAQIYRDRFTEWARYEKTRESIAAGWGSIGSGGAFYGNAASW